MSVHVGLGLGTQKDGGALVHPSAATPYSSSKGIHGMNDEVTAPDALITDALSVTR